MNPQLKEEQLGPSLCSLSSYSTLSSSVTIYKSVVPTPASFPSLNPLSSSSSQKMSSHLNHNQRQPQQFEDYSLHPHHSLNVINEDMNGSRRSSHTGFSLNSLLEEDGGGESRRIIFDASPPPNQPLQSESHQYHSSNNKSLHFDKGWTGDADHQSEATGSRTRGYSKNDVLSPFGSLLWPTTELLSTNGNSIVSSSLNSIASFSNNHHQRAHRHHPYLNTSTQHHVCPQRSSFDATQGPHYPTIIPASGRTYTSVLTRRYSAPATVYGMINLRDDKISPSPNISKIIHKGTSSLLLSSSNNHLSHCHQEQQVLRPPPISASQPPPGGVTTGHVCSIMSGTVIPLHRLALPIHASRLPPPPSQPLLQEISPSVSSNSISIKIEQKTETPLPDEQSPTNNNFGHALSSPTQSPSSPTSSYSVYMEGDEDDDEESYTINKEEQRTDRERNKRTSRRRNGSSKASADSAVSGSTQVPTKIKCNFPNCRRKFSSR